MSPYHAEKAAAGLKLQGRASLRMSWGSWCPALWGVVEK